MNFFFHAIIALALSYCVAFFLGVSLSAPLIIVIGVLGGLLPDLDCDKSKIFRLTSLLFFASCFYLLYSFFEKTFGFVEALLASFFFSSFFVFVLRVLKPRHRGVFHSFLFALFFGAGVFFLTSSTSFGVIGFAAYSSHLLADGVFKIV
ncbi:MAG: metal-dependent hydrolase [Candidatus Micrarchaeota archaeon]